MLSAQFMTAPTGNAREIRNFPPAEPPRPKNQKTEHLNLGYNNEVISLKICMLTLHERVTWEIVTPRKTMSNEAN